MAEAGEFGSYALAYLTATDPEVAKRTWQVPMDEMTKTKTGPTYHRTSWR